jgi:hypothetical protein
MNEVLVIEPTNPSPENRISPDSLEALYRQWEPLCREKPDLARQYLYPYLSLASPSAQAITDRMVQHPNLYAPNIPIADRSCSYYGIHVMDLPPEAARAHELTVGLLSVHDSTGGPIGLLDLHPNAYPNGAPLPAIECAFHSLNQKNSLNTFLPVPHPLIRQLLGII